VRRVVVCVCLLASWVKSPIATVVTVTTSTPLRLSPHGEPVIAVRVNGLGPFPFILDTGSTHSSISDRLSQSLGTPAVAKTTVSSSLGEHVQPVVSLDRLEVGPATLTQILATEVPEASLNEGGHVRGVLGQDVLGSLVYTLDFAANRVEWNPELGAGSTRGSTLALRSARGRFLAELPQQRTTLWLVPDSGAETLVLYERPQLQLPPLTRSTERAWLSTLSDLKEVEAVHVTRFRVGDTNLTDVPAVLVKRDDADPSFGDGLLPLTLFARVTFDGPGHRLIVDR
jgi:hypothetical protein